MTSLSLWWNILWMNVTRSDLVTFTYNIKQVWTVAAVCTASVGKTCFQINFSKEWSCRMMANRIMCLMCEYQLLKLIIVIKSNQILTNKMWIRINFENKSFSVSLNVEKWYFHLLRLIVVVMYITANMKWCGIMTHSLKKAENKGSTKALWSYFTSRACPRQYPATTQVSPPIILTRVLSTSL